MPSDDKTVAPDAHIKELRLHHKTTTTAIKNFTIKIIVKITGTFIQSILSIFACIVYVVSTYYPDAEDLSSPTGIIFNWLEIIIAALFSVDYIFGFISAKNKKKFLLNVMNIIDLLTILPVMVNLVGESNLETNKLKFARIIRAIRVFRILRLYRLFGTGKKDSDLHVFNKDEIRKRVIMIITTIIALIFIATGLLHSFNEIPFLNFTIQMPIKNQKLTFDAAFYFMITTFATIGLGDIKPVTVSAKMTIFIFIILMIAIAIKQISDLSDILKFNSEFRNAYDSETDKHIVLLGEAAPNSIFKFLKEFYHSDHHVKEVCKVVIVQRNAPSKEV